MYVHVCAYEYFFGDFLPISVVHFKMGTFLDGSFFLGCIYEMGLINHLLQSFLSKNWEVTAGGRILYYLN